MSLGWHISLEPQAQIIWQHLSLDNERDAISGVGFDTPEGFTGRLDLCMQGSVQTGKMLWQPYLKVNLWYGFEGTRRSFLWCCRSHRQSASIISHFVAEWSPHNFRKSRLG
jgi:Autotransporter beta-domain